MKLFIFLAIITLLCRADLLDKVIQLLDAQKETNVGYRITNPNIHRRRRTYKPDSWFDGGGKIAPDKLDAMYYKDLTEELDADIKEDMNKVLAHFTHVSTTSLTSKPYGGPTAAQQCELACSLIGDGTQCVGYMFGEVESPGVIHHTTWGNSCNMLGSFSNAEMKAAYRQNLVNGFWEGWGSVYKGSSDKVEEELSLNVDEESVAFANVRNMRFYLKQYHKDFAMPTDVVGCYDGKVLVKFSNGGTACEDPVDWNTAPCNKLKHSEVGRDKWGISKYGYGCRGAVSSGPDPGKNFGNWNDKSGKTSSSVCKNGSWYNRCCSYDSEYEVCYPKVTDCKIWPKRIQPNILANTEWFMGPCMYAIETNGHMSPDYCAGGNTQYHEGKYMWFKQCCRVFKHILNKDSATCNTRDIDLKNRTPKWQLVFPRKKGQTYYYN